MSNVLQLGTPPPAYYDKILMRANPTLHEQAFARLQSIAPKGASVIDVGSGQGAFAARMRDHGYAVTSVDKNPDDFLATGVDFVYVDFDVPTQIEDFKRRSAEQFDVAVGMEVIEHVENPWEYCRFLLSLTKPGGIVLLTTPNAESIQSRIDFLFSGRFAHFSRADYTASGHVNPLTFHEMALIADSLGVEVLEVSAICPLPWLVVSRRLSSVFSSILASILRPFLGPRGSGDIICLILRKPT